MFSRFFLFVICTCFFFSLSAQNKGWYQLDDKKGGYYVEFPSEPQKIPQEVPNPYDEEGEPFIMNMYLFVDVPNLTNYLVGYNDYPAGYYLTNKYEVFDALPEEMAAKGEVLQQMDTIWLGDIEGRRIYVELEGGFYSELRFYIRGNRTYKILRQNLVRGKRGFDDDDFFPTFRFEPFQSPALSTLQPKNQSFKTQFLSKPIIDTSELDYQNSLKTLVSYSVTNPKSGGVYLVETGNFSNLYRLEHLDTLIDESFEVMNSYSDTVVSSKIISNGALYGKEIIVRNQYNGAMSRRSMYIFGTKFVFITAFLADEEIESELSNTIFNSIELTEEIIPAFDIYSSKTDLIKEGLFSEDTTIYNTALGAFAYHVFQESDLPTLYELAQTTFADDSTEIGARSNIIREFITIKDSTTFPFLVSLYKSDINDLLKFDILRAIDQQENPERLETYYNLFLNNPPDTKNRSAYSIFNLLKDSLAYAADHIDKIIPLLENEDYYSLALDLCAEIALEEEHREVIKLNFDKITKKAWSAVDTMMANGLANEFYYSSEVADYLLIMREVKGQALTDQYSDKIISLLEKKHADVFVFFRAIDVRISNDLEVDKKLFKKATSGEYPSYIVINSVIKNNKLDMLPSKMLNQEYLADLVYKDFLYDNEEYNIDLNLLGTIQSGDSIAFVFSHTSDYSSSPMLGIIGMFYKDEIPGNLNFLKSFSNWDMVKEDWKLQAKEELLIELNKFGW